MGVRINGVWHEELADPGTGGTDEGAGRNFTSAGQYNQTSQQLAANNAWGENLNTVAREGAAPGTVPVVGADGSVQQLGSQIDTLLNAIASGNKQAFDEAVRQFNVTFGLDQSKFTEAVRQFNENLTIAQSGLTGQYQGAPTLPALTGYATQFGTWGTPQQGAETLAAQQQRFAQGIAGGELTGMYQGAPTMAMQQQQYAQQLGAINAAAALQANPFRQAQVIGQLGGLLGGRGVAGFQAPGQAQGQTDFSGMGNMQRLIDDIRGGTGAVNSQSTQGVLDAIPTPTKLDSVNFLRSSPLTQSLVLQGMQEKYGLSPDDSLAQIKNTLPQFASPTTLGGIKR